MAHALNTGGPSAVTADHGRAIGTRPAYQAYQLLHVGYAVLPLVAGLDKFFGRLVNWEVYLAPAVPQMLGITAHTFMMAVGVVEIAAGVLVALKPRYGGYVVALWLWGIIANLLLIPGYFDVALRDFGLSLGALALARLGHEFDRTTPVSSGVTP
jgi:hypothetical protein